jgi:type IV pilus assembly protein PilN
MSTLTATATPAQTMPRVNLLPPEIRERAALRRAQAGLGATVLVALGAVGALYLVALDDANAARADLAGATEIQRQLKAEEAKYVEVPAVFSELRAAEANRDQALGQEVRWSYYLNDLGLSIPANVWLTQVSITQNVDGAATTTAAPTASAGTASGTAGATATPGIGQITFAGKALSHDDVATWLESLAKQKGYADPSFSNSAQETIGDRKVVAFTSTVTVTEDALSGRYTAKAGQ